MPTGYCMNIEDDDSFEHFVAQCAYGFGALVNFRDSDVDRNQLPDEIPISDHHPKGLIEAESLEESLSRMKQVHIDSYNLKKREKAVKDLEGRMKKNKVVREKYRVMLEKVRNWTPPSNDHVGLKDLMIDNLLRSIDADSSTKYEEERLVEAKERNHYEKDLEKATKDIQYHFKEHQAEKERARKRMEWINLLKDSL